MGPWGYQPAMVRHEPEYPDQVPRREAYEAAHPDTVITYHGRYWKAVIPEQDGSTEFNRHTLEALLNKLDSLGDGP